MGDEATLRDTVVTDPTTEPKTVESKAEAAEVKSDLNPEAAEIGRILMESGVTKSQLNDLMAAPQALNAMRHAIQTDPQEFLRMLERSDPGTADKFQESLTDLYIARHGDKAKSTSKPAKTDDTATDLMREVEILREKTNRLETEQQRRDNAVALASAQARYNSRVDSLMDLKEVKEMKFTPSETKALKARLSAELATDPQIVQRVSTGNFVDVPQAFKGLIEEWAADKKAIVEGEKSARDRAAKGSFAEFLQGPDAQMLDIPTNTFDSWDNTEDGFAKALERSR